MWSRDQVQSILHTADLTPTLSANIGFSFSRLFFICSFTALSSFIKIWHLTETSKEPREPQSDAWGCVCIGFFFLPLHTSQYPGTDSWLVGWSPCCCAPPGPTCSPRESAAPCSDAVHHGAATISQATENRTKMNRVIFLGTDFKREQWYFLTFHTPNLLKCENGLQMNWGWQ